MLQISMIIIFMFNSAISLVKLGSVSIFMIFSAPFFIFLFSLAWGPQSIFNVLLLLEGMMLSLIFMISYLVFEAASFAPFLLTLLVMGVTGAALGLSLLINYVRDVGNSALPE